MLTNADKKSAKSAEKFSCEICDFKCSRVNGFKRHLATDKHKMLTNADAKSAESATPSFECLCGKTYQHRQSLFIHRKKCQKNNDKCLSDYLVLEIIKQNKELINQNHESQKQVLEVLKNNTTNINNSTNNSHNKTFNLQLYVVT